MDRDSQDDARDARSEESDRGEIVAFLLRDGVIGETELRHAERVRSKLGASRPLVPLLLELGSLHPDRLQAVLSRHRLGLRIGALLVELGILPAASVAHALAQQAEEESEAGAPVRKLGEILVDLGFLGAQQLAETLASQLGIPCVPPGPLDPDPALLDRVPLALCRAHRFLPIRREQDRVWVAFADPLDKGDAAAAQAHFGPELAVLIATPAVLEEAWARLDLGARVAADSTSADSAAASVLDELVELALRTLASHVHVEPERHRLVLRLRCDGVLVPWRELPPGLGDALLRRLARACDATGEEGAPTRAGRLCVERTGRSIAFEVSFLTSGGQERATLRRIGCERPALALGQLGLLESMRLRLEERVLGTPGGLLLVAGPSRAGRSTTLEACVRALSTPTRRVVLLDPPAGGATAERVAWALDQDPDVVAVHDVRGSTEMAALLRAASQGPFMLGVVDSEGAVSALLSTAAVATAHGLALPGVLAALGQRLVRRSCEACARPMTPTPALLRRLGVSPLDVAGAVFQAGSGCGRCSGSGYEGRTGLFELDVLDEEGREHLRAGGDAGVLRRDAARVGPATLLEDGLCKAAAGLTTLDELLRVVPRGAKARPLGDIRIPGESP